MRIRRIYIATGCSLLLAASGIMLWSLATSTNHMLFGTIITRVQTSDKVVALTFDDGPLPGTTEKTLAELKELGIKATFFTIGVESKRHPQQLADIIAAGHEVGNHSYSHAVMVFKTYSDVTKEVEANDTLIRSAGYTGPIPFRTPYNIKLAILPYYLKRQQRPDISHDVQTHEGWAYTPQEIAADIVRQVKPGSIILLHPMYKHTISSRRAISQIVEDLRAKGYSFVTISQLLAHAKT